MLGHLLHQLTNIFLLETELYDTINVYRTKINTDIYYFVGEINHPTTTSIFIDEIQDNDLSILYNLDQYIKNPPCEYNININLT